jgi:hypothetical protein
LAKQKDFKLLHVLPKLLLLPVRTYCRPLANLREILFNVEIVAIQVSGNVELAFRNELAYLVIPYEVPLAKVNS